MTLKSLASSFVQRAKTFLSDIFVGSSSASFFAPFLSGYYAYLGIAITIMTGNPIVFVTFALPAVIGLVFVFVDAYNLTKQELAHEFCTNK
jgi:hypothetical protein